MHVATDEVVRRLRALGVSGKVRHLDAETRTAAMGADQLVSVRITGGTPMAVGADG